MSGPEKHVNTCVDVMYKNLQSFNEDKKEEMILRIMQQNLWAVCLQKSWRIGDATWENGRLTLIHHGLSGSAPRLASRSFSVRKFG